MADIPEALARDDVARIYADLRRVTGEPGVNLIYRHLATFPGALAWSWRVLRPLFQADALTGPAKRIVTAATLDGLPNAAGKTFAGFDPPATERHRIGAVLGFYLRANPRNLIGLVVLEILLTRLDEGGGPANPGPAPWDDEEAPAAANATILPPLCAAAELAPDARRAADGLAAISTDGPGGPYPSAIRHLMHWPELLAPWLAFVEPLNANGELAAAAARMAVGAREFGAALAREIAGPPSGAAFPASARKATRNALQAFTPMIPRTTVALGLLQACLGQSANGIVG